MRYEVANERSMTVLTLKDELVANDKGQFDEVVAKATAAGGAVWVDMARLEFMDSAGLGFLLKLWQKCKDQGRSVTLSGAKGEVKELLDLSDFQILFTIE